VEDRDKAEGREDDDEEGLGPESERGSGSEGSDFEDEEEGCGSAGKDRAGSHRQVGVYNDVGECLGVQCLLQGAQQLLAPCDVS